MPVVNVLNIEEVILNINHILLNNLYSLTFALAALLNKKNTNFLSFVLIVLFFRAFDAALINEYVLFNDYLSPYWFYFIYSAYDMLLITALMFRYDVIKVVMQLSLNFSLYFRKESSIDLILIYQRHVDEFKIMSVYFFGIVVNMLTAIEDLSSFGGDFFYKAYQPIKMILMAYEVFLVFKIGSQSNQ